MKNISANISGQQRNREAAKLILYFWNCWSLLLNGQQGEVRHPSWSGASTPGVPRTGPVGASPEEGHQDD